MDRGQDRRLDQPAIGQGHKIVVAVYQVKLGCMLECFGYVKVFGYFGIDIGIFFIALVHCGVKASTGYRVPAGE
jgi:hypothetical protein